MTMNVYSADRRGRGWETRWTRKKDKVTLEAEPDGDGWQRLPETVKTATLDYHRVIATARAKQEHNAAKADILYRPKPNPIAAVRWRGDLDSLQHVLKVLLDSNVDPTVGAAKRSFQATTRTRMSFTRHTNGSVSLSLVRAGGGGAVTVQAGSWLYVEDDRLDTMADTEFHERYTK